MNAGSVLRAVRKILLVQALVVGVVAAVFFGLSGFSAARSAFLGGLAALVPNLCFGYLVARSRAQTAQSAVHAFFLGETIKLALTAALFYLVFQLPDIAFFPLFAGFIAVIVVFWFSLVWGTNAAE